MLIPAFVFQLSLKVAVTLTLTNQGDSCQKAMTYCAAVNELTISRLVAQIFNIETGSSDMDTREQAFTLLLVLSGCVSLSCSTLKTFHKHCSESVTGSRGQVDMLLLIIYFLRGSFRIAVFKDTL